MIISATDILENEAQSTILALFMMFKIQLTFLNALPLHIREESNIEKVTEKVKTLSFEEISKFLEHTLITI